jgi:hypothetical protein
MTTTYAEQIAAALAAPSPHPTRVTIVANAAGLRVRIVRPLVGTFYVGAALDDAAAEALAAEVRQAVTA